MADELTAKLPPEYKIMLNNIRQSDIAYTSFSDNALVKEAVRRWHLEVKKDGDKHATKRNFSRKKQ